MTVHATGTVDANEVRLEVRSWLEEHWDPESSLADWRNLLADSGWACPTWPVEWYGRGLPPAMAAVVAEEFERIGAIGTPEGTGMVLVAPTLLEHGSDELKALLLRPIITGEQTWCQLFSEPGSGSDLAGLTTRADRDGDEFVVNGQKVWNTSAHHADYGMLLARTNWDAPKHRGITYFCLPMHQPGRVEPRPLRQMNGHASFNEVFLTDARVPAANVVGRVDDGWAVALATLAHERRLVAVRGGNSSGQHANGRAGDEFRDELDRHLEPYRWYPQRAGRVDLIVERAQAAGRNNDPVVRQQIAKLLSMQRTAQWTTARARAARELGRPPGPEGSLAKLSASNIAKLAADVHTLISGISATITGPEGLLDGVIAEILISVPAVSIAGGTDQVQRNIIAERILSLPKEPQLDRDRPFREVPKNRAGLLEENHAVSRS